ncbi:DNA-binding transcriptional regulator, ArsR family [Pseudonocardia thermophila]|uniref:DNA-binding transcriptional regulator, ArsR family n=1 Tax=Pseudonocardia thermophila TaxID=1848 RepID=A0A1M6NS84_PSETH|nr:metalloregulator ArsR/SmtB family transcription factor [Pseudonocardia thermophila]SHJ98442.1 DNA-binding transcriptional regulator, ArsR family [Pseudonocardia thermophila]
MHRVPESRRDLRVIDPDQVCDASAVISDAAQVRHAAAVLDGLGDPNRLSILLALHHAGDLCVSDLAVAVGMSDSAVSHALRLLRALGMVEAHRQGRLVRYRIDGEFTRKLLDVISESVVGDDVELHAHPHSHARSPASGSAREAHA